MDTKYRFRQIRIDKSLYIRIKGYCVAKDIKIGTFFDEILQWFIQELSMGLPVVYQASRQENYLMTIRISHQLAIMINTFAVREKVSDARVIFTALSLYLETHGI